MARIPQITERNGLDPAQQAVFDSIVSGARGAVRGPHSVLLNRPEIAAPMERLGAFVRYECAVPERQRELAILVVAAHWQAEYEWFAHAPLAAKAGIAEDVITAIGHRQAPDFASADDALVHGFAREFIDTKQVSDATFKAAEERFGATGVLDLVSLLGYYTNIAMVLNAFKVAPPVERPYPWQDPADLSEGLTALRPE